MFTANSLRVGARSRLVLLSHLSVLPLVLPYSGLEPATFGRCVVLLVRTFAYTSCRPLYRVKLVRVCQFRYHQSSLKLVGGCTDLSFVIFPTSAAFGPVFIAQLSPLRGLYHNKCRTGSVHAWIDGPDKCCGEVQLSAFRNLLGCGWQLQSGHSITTD